VFPVGATGVRETEFQEQMFRNELRVKFTSDNAVLACQSIDEIVGKFRNPLLSGGGIAPGSGWSQPESFLAVLG
jgi:hypothetical protein